MSLAKFSDTAPLKVTRVLVSKETMVLRRWGRETQNFGVDKVDWSP